jgi:hypothetical protein
MLLRSFPMNVIAVMVEGALSARMKVEVPLGPGPLLNQDVVAFPSLPRDAGNWELKIDEAEAIAVTDRLVDGGAGVGDAVGVGDAGRVGTANGLGDRAESSRTFWPSQGSEVTETAEDGPEGAPSAPTSTACPGPSTTTLPVTVRTSTVPSYTANRQVGVGSQATVKAVPRTVATAVDVEMENPS